MAVIAASMVTLGPGVASAEEHRPVKDVVDSVRAGVEQEARQEGQQTPSTDGVAGQQGDASSSGATQDPGTHAKGEVAKVALGGQDVLDLARSEASIGDDDSAHSDATLLALGGQEIIGAHAGSDGSNESHAGDPLAALCEGSGGQLCLRVLFADAYATSDDHGSDALSQTGVLDACLGGDSADPRAACSGPASVGVLTSRAHTHRDRTDGSTDSQSESAGADVCLAPDGDTCGVGAEVLKSESSASSDGSSQGHSTLAELELGNQEVGSVDQPTTVDVQPNCAAPSAACVAANQGESTTGNGSASQSQDALDAGVLPDTAGGEVDLSHTDASATQGNQVLGVQAEAPGNGGSGGPGMPGAGGVGGGVLPNTGGVWSGLLSLAFGAIAAGAFLIVRTRRRLGAAV